MIRLGRTRWSSSLRGQLYLATVNESGWPYVQHRGGPTGFLHVLDPRTLAFADYQGNHQMISTATSPPTTACHCS
jgi:predicted pyridoxine 5'-phosphate oxidase superfamily flavin-nucleotide-binding protein